MCDIMDVNRSSLYYKQKPKKQNIEIENMVIEIFNENKKVYGAKKIKIILEERNIFVSKRTIRKIMEKYNLVSCYNKRSYKPAKSGVNDSKNQNLLNQNFNVDQEMRVVVSDLTYVRVKNRWAYICVLVDLFNREIISYKVGYEKDAELVLETFAKIKHKLRKIEIFHTDRGMEFKNYKIDNLLLSNNIKHSLSRKGCPYDNAVCENIYKTIKTEFVRNRQFESLVRLEIELAGYIYWYNNKRIHGALDYMTPMDYKKCRLAV